MSQRSSFGALHQTNNFGASKRRLFFVMVWLETELEGLNEIGVRFQDQTIPVRVLQFPTKASGIRSLLERADEKSVENTSRTKVGALKVEIMVAKEWCMEPL